MALEEQRNCSKHGLTKFKKLSSGKNRPNRWSCVKCIQARQSKRRIKNKELLVNEFGGSCLLCGYNKLSMALDFHHLDSSDKSFGLADGVCRLSLETCRQEASKCILVCKNCHSEIEFELPETMEKLKRALIPK